MQTFLPCNLHIWTKEQGYETEDWYFMYNILGRLEYWRTVGPDKVLKGRPKSDQKQQWTQK